jgi:DNA-binding transcriptional regulator LsrR (DeoR family)
MERELQRDELLAFVAEKYYGDGLKQSEIADLIGVTRSAVSRMLTEARHKGLVEIIIHHPLQYDQELENKLRNTFNLKQVAVISYQGQQEYEELKKKLGKAASRLLTRLLKPGYRIGIAWGTSVQATVEAFEHITVNNTRVIQLVGVLGSSRQSYSAQTLVDQMAQKISGEGTYLYAPFIVENGHTAASLLDDPTVESVLASSRDCDIALMGVGTTKPAFCSLYQGKHITLEDLKVIQKAGGIGDVCGLYYDHQGELLQIDFQKRRIGIALNGLLEIPLRLAVAGNPEKAVAILGAIRGDLINSLVTDSLTAVRLLKLVHEPNQETAISSGRPYGKT